jgi:hypothetical protein
MTRRKLPHELCMGLTGKVKLKPTPDAQESQTVIYARAKPGRGTFTGQDGQDYTLRRSYNRMDNPSTTQLQGRARLAEATRQWRAKPVPEKQAYRLRAEALHMTGFNLWVKEFCAANPLEGF